MQNQIMTIISGTPRSAREIRREIGGDARKKEINQVLYRLLKDGMVTKVDGTPPKWVVDAPPAAEAPVEEDEDRILVFIDADNSHCLEEVVPYCSSSVQIFAAVSQGYNGYIPQEGELTKFVTVTSGSKGAAEARLCAWMAEAAAVSMVKEPKGELTIVIVSKNRFCETFASQLMEMYDERLFELNVDVIANSWEGLRELLE